VRLVGSIVGARATDVGVAGPNRFVLDRDWRLAVVGAELDALTAGRLGVALGVQGGPMWWRDRRVGTVGTPVPSGLPDLGAGRATWSAGAALVPGINGTYRIRGALGLSARAAVAQHVFTDNLIGTTGALAALGARLAW
jgi:hypothetical protein